MNSGMCAPWCRCHRPGLRAGCRPRGYTPLTERPGQMQQLEGRDARHVTGRTRHDPFGPKEEDHDPIGEGLMTAARDLADRFHQRWLEANPFAATMYGIPGYDHLVPDESEEGEQAWRAEAERFGAEADAIAREQLTPAEAVTLDCTRQA